MIGNRTRAKSFVNFSIEIKVHRVSQSMLGGPRRCLLSIFFEANTKNLQTLIPKSLPNLFFDNRSLLLTPLSERFPKNQKYRMAPEV